MIDPSVEERWDGANGNVEKFDVKVQAELLSRGGRSYMRFYTGDYSSEAFEKFLRSVFSGVWYQPKLEDANFDEPTADGVVLYPPRYLELVEHFIDGATNISHEKSNYSVKQMRKYMSEGDRCLFGHLCNLTRGASAPHILVHSMHGKPGSTIRSKLFEKFDNGNPANHFQKLRGTISFHTGILNPFPFTLTENIRRWIGCFDDIRCEMVCQLNYDEAKSGCLQNGDGSFNAFADYATGIIRYNCQGEQRKMSPASIRSVLMAAWQNYIKNATNYILPVNDHGQAAGDALQSNYGQFTVPFSYPYKWDEQRRRFVDTRRFANVAGSIDIISSDEEEKESESDVESDVEVSDVEEKTGHQSIASDKLSMTRSGTIFKNRSSTSHGGKGKRNIQQNKRKGQKKMKPENSGT